MKTLALRLACKTDKMLLFVDVDFKSVYTKIFSDFFSKRWFRNCRHIFDPFKNILFIIFENHEKTACVVFHLIVCRGSCIGGKVYLTVKIEKEFDKGKATLFSVMLVKLFQ